MRGASLSSASDSAGELAQELVEACWLKNHQEPADLPLRQHHRMRQTGWNMHRRSWRRGQPVAVEIEIDVALEDIERLGVLPMQMQTERKSRA